MKKLKLNYFETNKLSKEQQNSIIGGDWTCTCSCYYADNGGSSEMDNGCANAEIGPGGHSTKGDNHYCVCVCTP